MCIKLQPKHTFQAILLLMVLAACGGPQENPDHSVNQYEKLTISFQGDLTDEQAENNHFLHQRLVVDFTHTDGSTVSIPGFYAADGNAAETSADSGNVWQVRFRPNKPGFWTYKASFKSGSNIAISDDFAAGDSIAFDGQTGTIKVAEAYAAVEGRLEYVGERYPRYSRSGRYFIKGGADSPENFLAYVDFDNTRRGRVENREGEASMDEGLHHFKPHLNDWNVGDPTWQGGKGKSMIGALNYLASKGMNVVYFLVMNIEGDGKEVYPYTSYEERLRFDASKLDQWEIVFDHMDELGLSINMVLQETENELLLDSGNTTFERKLYYREMIARFGHHPRLTWNMGEENGPAHWSPNGQSTEQQKAMIAYFQEHDPYDNMVVIHSHSTPDTRDHIFEALLGDKNLDGMSMQVSDKRDIHEVTKKWSMASKQAGNQWVMNMDEMGWHWRGVDPDDRPDNNQDTVRREALWGNLMAGGAGTEWYFGYRNHDNDLNCEDWRSRDRMWDYTRAAMKFFESIPFHRMDTHDELLTGAEGYCFAEPGKIYTVYLKYGGEALVDITKIKGKATLQWYNPRSGILGKESFPVEGGTKMFITAPNQNDWVAIITNDECKDC